MTYLQALDYIHSLEVFGSKLGLERVRMLLQALGNPQDKLRFVHIAGTNGKGSTASMTAQILHTAGYKTGLYISPYVVEFRERMQINGQMIPKQALAALVAHVKATAEKLGEQITEFEFITAAALYWYAQENCDIIVLEVGLGGRFDATNVISAPEVAVITAIDLDHTQILGNSIAQIAFEKCGIIKKGCAVVSYPAQHPEALAVIMERCAAENASLFMGNLNSVQVREVGLAGSNIVWGELELHIPLIGEHQIYNTLTVLEIIRCLRARGFSISGAQLAQGIANTSFPSRMEKLSETPLIFIDGAHNLAGARALAQALKLFEGKRIFAVAGMLADKDYTAALACVGPYLHQIFTAAPQNPRALSAADFAAAAAPYCKAQPCATALEAWQKAKAAAQEGDVLLIWGSLYLSSDLRGQIIRELEGK